MIALLIKKTISTAKFESPSYFSAKIAVVLPAGIPAKTVATAVTNGGRLTIAQLNKTNKGIKIQTDKTIVEGQSIYNISNFDFCQDSTYYNH